MGLDQYAYLVVPEAFETQHIFPGEPLQKVSMELPSSNDLNSGCVKIAQWRKHWPLQNWMQALYSVKGGTKEFNCENVLVELADLDVLERLIKSGGFDNQAHTYAYEAEYRAFDLAFIQRAREGIKVGQLCWYDSWW